MRPRWHQYNNKRLGGSAMEIMLNVEDVVRGLKRLKSLAKQDLLISSKTANPAFYYCHALSRKQKYEDLIMLVSEHGVTAAYDMALKEYLELPEPTMDDAQTRGQLHALEMFLQTMGLDKQTLMELKAQGTSAEVQQSM